MKAYQKAKKQGKSGIKAIAAVAGGIAVGAVFGKVTKALTATKTVAKVAQKVFKSKTVKKLETKIANKIYTGIPKKLTASSTKTLKKPPASGFVGHNDVIKTPYGNATQSVSKEAKAVKTHIENGGTVYRGGTLGRSKAAEGQFWAPENPLNPGYAKRYGVDFSKIDFIVGGKVKSQSKIITRHAPGLDNNGGGAVEMVTDPNNVKLDFFYMP